MKTNPSSILLFEAILACSTPAILAQPAISNFMAAPGNAQVALSWNSSMSAAGYNVKQATSATAPLTVIANNLPNPGLVVTNLRNGTIYFFAVTCVSDGFESADTTRLKAVPSAPVPDLLPAGAKLEKLASGLAATEGPVWDPAGGYLIFSDQLNNRLLRWTPGSGITIYRQPSNRANGNALDQQGRLITCEAATRSVTRTEIDGTVTPLVTEYNGKKFNEPNDVVVKSDGTVWFTDPAYSNPQTQPGRYVYRFDPTNGNATVTAVATNLNQPNGLCFSSDETKLFVADTGLTQIRVLDVISDNSLTNSRVFVPEAADGIRATSEGRLLLSSITGSIRIFAPDGLLLGALAVPETPANLCFAGTNREMLFITASTSLYGITRMPDLIVTAINRFPANPLSGQSVAFSAVIKNQGTAPTLEGVPNRVAFSIDRETNVVWSEFTASLSPDASVVLTANGGERTRTWTATEGTHSVKAMVDSLNAHRESNESNNVFAQNFSVAMPASDSDGDGSNDLDEAMAGTDPTNAASVLKILAAVRLAGDRLALTWSSVPGKIYRVSRVVNLGNLESAEFSRPVTATSVTTSWSNNLPFTRPVQFLRVNVVP
jgi:gluconolactonase